MRNLLTYKQVELLSESAIQMQNDEDEPMQSFKNKYYNLMKMVTFEFKPKGFFARKQKVTVWTTPTKDKIFDIKSDVELPFSIGDDYSEVDKFIEDNNAEVIKIDRGPGKGRRKV